MKGRSQEAKLGYDQPGDKHTLITAVSGYGSPKGMLRFRCTAVVQDHLRGHSIFQLVRQMMDNSPKINKETGPYQEPHERDTPTRSLEVGLCQDTPY